MSMKAMLWAFKQQVSPTEKLVLLALGDHADNEGVCWPGLRGLAEKTGLNRHTIGRAALRLEQKGVIKIERRKDELNRYLSGRYFLQISTNTPTESTTEWYSEPRDGEYPESTIREEQSTKEPSRIIPPSQNPVSEAEVWADSPWLIAFLKEQTTFNGLHLPKLLDHDFWADLSETINLNLATCQREFAKMSIWLRDNRQRAPTPRGVRRFVAGWLERAYERERRMPNGQSNQIRR